MVSLQNGGIYLFTRWEMIFSYFMENNFNSSKELHS